MKEKVFLIGESSKISKIIKYHLKSKYTFLGSSRRHESEYYLDLRNIHNRNLDLPKNTQKVIITSGMTSILECEKNPVEAYQTNVVGTCHLINQLEKLKINYLFISSSAVFSMNAINLFEESSREPSCVYGMNKKEVEDYIISSNYGSILRLTKLIDSNFSLLLKWHKRLVSNMHIEAFEDLKIAPVTPKSLSNWIDYWLRNSQKGIYHISSSNEISYYRLALELANYFKLSTNLIHSKKCCLLEDKPLYIPIEANLKAKDKRSLISPINDEILEIWKNISN